MDRSGLALTIGIAAETVRESAPIVHCVVPWAATSFVADVLHGVGARSVVTGTSADALGATTASDAFMLDFATLNVEWSDHVNPSVAQARAAGVPWVLDVTRLGRASLRPDRLRALLSHRPVVVRADAAEVEGVRLDGGETTLVVGAGDAERVIAGSDSVPVGGGAEMLAQIPGVRSAASALTAAMSTVAGPLESALAGAAWLALASERAAEGARGPASFRTGLIDALWTIHGDEIAEYLHLR